MSELSELQTAVEQLLIKLRVSEERQKTSDEAFKTHPKYEAALGIIRAKITNAASDILISNNTAYNIEAIIDRLDFSYQRTLYVVEAKMTSIKQSNKSLQEYYDKLNQALNIVISKIVMTYKSELEQHSLIAETQCKAVRAFIMGLHSHTAFSHYSFAWLD